MLRSGETLFIGEVDKMCVGSLESNERERRGVVERTEEWEVENARLYIHRSRQSLNY